MSGQEIALAMSLLVAPPGNPFPDVSADEWPGIQTAIHHVAVQWEIMDPREVKFLLTRQEDMKEDLDLLRKRQQDLQDAPRVNDSMRFPDRKAVNEMLTFNRAFRRYVDMKTTLEPDRRFDYGETLRETDRLYQVWDAVRDARCDFYYVNVRRQALKRVRELVGAEAYYNANLPPSIPTWRFQEMP
jgi:hypothetical protein